MTVNASEASDADASSRSLPPLIRYTLQGLETLWMPERQRYSYIYRLDDAKPGNVSVPDRDTFYTLNVLLGLTL